MKHKKTNNRLIHAPLLVGVALLLSSFSANAGFFDSVDQTITAEEMVDGTSAQLKNSVTTPDGRFTYVSGLNGIFIFSRDQNTGDLTQTGLFSGESFAGDNVVVSSVNLAVSPDNNFVYMAGNFGYTSGTEGDAPIQNQTTVVKFDRDTETGMLTFNSHVDMDFLNFKSISEVVLSSDGNSLMFARSNGNVESTDVYLVNTVNMQPVFTLTDDQSGASVLPASTELKLALSPDENTLYLARPVANRNKDAVPAFAVINIDRNANSLSVKQTLVEDFFEGLDVTVDIANLNALFNISSIQPSDDGKYVYTVGSVRTAEELNSTAKEAIGLWNVESGGTLSLVRSLDKQEIVFDTIGQEGGFVFPSDLALSTNGNHFLYAAEEQFFDGQSSLTVFARDSDTGLLTYIDDNVDVVAIERVGDISITPGGRYINLTQPDAARTMTVIDTAVDRTVTLNITDNATSTTDEVTTNTFSLQAIASNNGPTDDYATVVLIEKSAGVESLTTDNANCSVIADGNISCTALSLLVGNQTSFNLTATSIGASSTNTVTATANSNKIDVDASNDSDSVDLVIDAGTVTPVTDNEEAITPVASSSGGGCSIGGPHSGNDLSILALLLASAGMLLRRKKKLVLNATSNSLK